MHLGYNRLGIEALLLYSSTKFRQSFYLLNCLPLRRLDCMGKKRKQSIESLRTRLREAADESGMTQQEIGEAMGFDPTSARKAVSRLLNPKIDYDPRLSTLLAFAQAIERPLGDLLK